MIRNTRFLSSRYLIKRKRVTKSDNKVSDNGKKEEKLNAMRPQMKEMATLSMAPLTYRIRD
jgi:hypothetical protein